MYPVTSVPAGIGEDISDWDNETIVVKCRVREIMRCCVVRDSTPGIPWSRWGATNQSVLETHFEEVATVVADRLRSLQSFCYSGQSPEELVRLGLCDPIKVFIKNEPHPVRKVKDGRFRLICSVSLVDQICERVLFRTQNQKEIEKWMTIPSSAGMGLEDAPMKFIYHEVRLQQEMGPVISTDISGWDWSVQEWDLEAEADARIILARAGFDSPFAHAVKARIACLSRKVFVLSNGHMYSQVHAGIQGSGSYITASGNSRMRRLNADLAGSTWARTMGDDCLENGEGDLETDYARLGKLVRDVVLHEEGCFEFCSTRWNKAEIGVPLTWDKTLYRFLSHKDNPQLKATWWVALLHDLRNHPRKEELLQLAQRYSRTST